MGTESKLLVGDQAPLFVVEDIAGRKIKLEDYKNKKLLISFFRYAGCPWCNLAIHRLTLEYAKLQSRGLNIIAFVQSKPENIRKNIIDRHIPPPPFPIVADSKMEVYKKYGVETSVKAGLKSIKDVPYWLKASKEYGFKQANVDGSVFLVPAEFLIGPPGLTIQKAHYGTSYYDQMPFLDIYDYLNFGG